MRAPRCLPVRILAAVSLVPAGCRGGAAEDGTFAESDSAELVPRMNSIVASAPDAAPGAPGAALFGRIGCNGCHMIAGVGGMVGPDLSAVGSRPSRDPARWPTTEDYVRASLRNPADFVVDGYSPAMPPPDQLGITVEDIEILTRYLLALTE
ncbi:MAG: c-type cytochrome [Gemmatimonadota bacterium]